MKKRLTVLALAFAMVLTMSASVFAVNPAPAEKQKAPDGAFLVKYVKMNEGVTNPTATYNFKLTPTAKKDIEVEGKKHDSVPTTDFPIVGDSTTITVNMNQTVVKEDAGISGTGDVVGWKSIAEIFDGVEFPHAGEYLYVVNEEDPTFTPSTGNVTDSLTKDSQTYTLHLYVTNEDVTNDDGDVVGNEPTITNVTVENEDGEKVDPSDKDPKPADGATGDKSRDSANYKADGFTFTDAYTKTVKQHEDPDDPTDPEMLANAFQVDKVVTGKYGDKTKKFDIYVTVQLPKGTSFDYASKITGETTGVTFDNTGKATVKLADSKNFGFSELPVGTKITVLEDDYTAEYKTQAWTTKATKDSDVTAAELGKTILVGEKGASAKVTNECKDDEVTPTGIIINNLPYVLLIGLALGGIVLFSRKRRYE